MMRRRIAGIEPTAVVNRRTLLLGGSTLALGAATATGALAQTGEAKWWEQVFGATSSTRRDTASRPPSEVEQLADLRTDNIPWRSDTMLEQMDGAIQRYEQIVQKGGWKPIPPGRSMRPGDDDERLPIVRRRLAASGEMRLEGSSFRETSFGFDDLVEEAVRRFQERHGLRLNGRVDRATMDAMNVSAMSRLEQLKLNRRRIQDLMQGRIEDRYVLVNAAAFQLEAVESFEVVQRHRIIAGKPDRQTPQIRATIRALNFFPFWRVPQSVATLDLIPRLRKEPEYLRQEMIRVYNGINGPELDPSTIDWNTADGTKLWFKQDPGERNALGLVRIDMPNPEIVYMHDTPLKPLFGQRGRAFSAGCVRVQDVMKLAEWIARHEIGWDKPGRTAEVVGAGQPLDLNLTRPIPVYFTYITAWAERTGRVHFQPDIYGRDGIRELSGGVDPDAPPPPPGIAALAP